MNLKTDLFLVWAKRTEILEAHSNTFRRCVSKVQLYMLTVLRKISLGDVACFVLKPKTDKQIRKLFKVMFFCVLIEGGKWFLPPYSSDLVSDKQSRNVATFFLQLIATQLRLLSLNSAQISVQIWEQGPELIKSVITLYFNSTNGGWGWHKIQLVV